MVAIFASNKAFHVFNSIISYLSLCISALLSSAWDKEVIVVLVMFCQEASLLNLLNFLAEHYLDTPIILLICPGKT